MREVDFKGKKMVIEWASTETVEAYSNEMQDIKNALSKILDKGMRSALVSDESKIGDFFYGSYGDDKLQQLSLSLGLDLTYDDYLITVAKLLRNKKHVEML